MPVDEPFAPEVIEAVLQHMNVDHADDCLVICRGLGPASVDQATSARMTGFDHDQATFAAAVGGDEEAVVVPWRTRLTDRGSIRVEVVRLYDDACDVLGVGGRRDDDH